MQCAKRGMAYHRPAHTHTLENDYVLRYGDEVKMRQAIRQRHVNTQADVNKIHGISTVTANRTTARRVRSTLFSVAKNKEQKKELMIKMREKATKLFGIEMKFHHFDFSQSLIFNAFMMDGYVQSGTL